MACRSWGQIEVQYDDDSIPIFSEASITGTVDDKKKGSQQDASAFTIHESLLLGKYEPMVTEGYTDVLLAYLHREKVWYLTWKVGGEPRKNTIQWVVIDRPWWCTILHHTRCYHGQRWWKYTFALNLKYGGINCGLSRSKRDYGNDIVDHVIV